MDWFNIGSLLLAPITGVVTWIAASTRRRNDSITMLQQTIDNLVLKNQDLYNEILRLRSRVNELECENKKFKVAMETNGIKL